MNVRQLRFFLQVAELGSVTRASSFLHIAQPALSRQIRQLEEELGVTLFQRSDKGVALTDAGRLLRDNAIGLLQHFERVRQQVRDEFNEPSGELTLAMPPSMFDLLTRPAIIRFQERYPGVALRVFEGISGVLNAWSIVQLGRADLAIVTNVEPLATLERTAFLEEALCLIGPPGSGLTIDESVDWTEVSRHTMIMPSRPNALRLVLETELSERRLPLRIGLEGNTPQLVLSMVEEGLGYTALPYCSAHRLFNEGRVTMAPIRGVEVSWTLIHSRDQPLSTAGERMKLMLRDIVREQMAAGHWRRARLPP